MKNRLFLMVMVMVGLVSGSAQACDGAAKTTSAANDTATVILTAEDSHTLRGTEGRHARAPASGELPKVDTID